jgi:hypothetical protein
MMRAELPDRLAYLATVVNELSKFDAAELGDDNPEALDIVESAARSRVGGLDGAEAKSVLEADCALLKEWLNQPGVEAGTGHYIYGALMGMIMWADFGDVAD